MSLDFCFRLEPGAGMARTDTGEPAACYCKVTFENVQVLPRTEEEYAVVHEGARKWVAGQIKKDFAHVTPISFKEWAENQEEEPTQ